MRQTGDYLTPHRPDGTPRFEKPLLTYWVLVMSYAVLGVNTIATRLPFLLAGCGVLWLTYRLALHFIQDPSVGLLSAAILVAHPVMFLSSIRSLPDILLTFFLLLSVDGLLSLIAEQRRDGSAYWAAYLGTGLAVATL